MRNYQLMGRKKVVAGLRKRNAYPLLHLHLMPLEILSQIFHNLKDDVGSLLLLALLCSKFNNIVCKNFLYHLIVFRTIDQFTRFAHAHLPQKTSLRRFGSTEPSTKINYIRSVHFINPPTASSTNTLTSIAGIYEVDTLGSVPVDYQSFVTHFRTLLNEAFGIKEVIISEILPKFEFLGDLLVPSSTSSLKLRFKSPRPARCLEKLVLTAQSGWNIPFKPVHIALFICIFDDITELRLKNFVIKEGKLLLDTPIKPISIDSLVLSACIYADPKKVQQRRKGSALFANTTLLTLNDLQHGADLSLIDFIKLNEKLTRLSIDIGSNIFYYLDQDKTSKFNFSKYNNFFKLVCSGQGGYSTLKEVVLTNFDLFHSFSHQHEKQLDAITEEDEEEQEDDWIEPPTNTFEYFLKHLSNVPFLTIVVKDSPKVMHTCVNCGFTVEETTKSITSLLPHEWAIILAPILCNKKCSVMIFDHSITNLFTRKRLEI